MVSAGWMALAVWLYVDVLLLDVSWNLVTWHPRLDLTSLAVLACAIPGLWGTWSLARATTGPASRIVAALACLTLVAVAIYAAPAEELSPGMFGRDSASPLWYRAARVVVMALPGVFLARHHLWR